MARSFRHGTDTDGSSQTVVRTWDEVARAYRQKTHRRLTKGEAYKIGRRAELKLARELISPRKVYAILAAALGGEDQALDLMRELAGMALAIPPLITVERMAQERGSGARMTACGV